MFSNIGGAATQIGDPPNIIIGAQLSSQSLSGTSLASQSIGFSDFIIHVAPAVLIAIIPAFWLLRIIEKPGLSGNRVRNVDLLRLQYGIKDSALLKKSGAILIVVIYYSSLIRLSLIHYLLLRQLLLGGQS